MTEAFVVVIPARLASSRLPNKPLADIGGKPMVVRVAEQARKSAAIDVIVATDHELILAACAEHKVKAVLTQPDHPSGTDRLAEVVDLLALPAETLVVNVQGDEPLIDPQLIDQLALSLANSAAPMASAAHPIHDAAEFFNPNVVKVVLNAKNEAIYFSRAPIPWARDAFAHDQTQLPQNGAVYRHIGIYAYRAGFLQTYQQLAVSPLEQIEALEQLRVLWHGEKIAMTVVAEAPAAGVDTAEDLVRVQALFAQQHND